MAQRARERKLPWYDAAFEQDYLARYHHRSDEAATAELPFLLTALALPHGARILDLCCGAGRHSRALKISGYRVLAVDRSGDLLKQAHALQAGGKEIGYVRADMRRLPLAGRSLDGAVNLFTSFGYFERDAENLQVLREVARVLKPGAPFVFDFLNLPMTLGKLVPRSEKIIGRTRLTQRRFFDRKTRRLVKITRLTGRGRTLVRRESVRAYSPVELNALFRRAGLEIVARFGDLFGSPFDLQASPRCVLVARPAGTGRRRRS